MHGAQLIYNLILAEQAQRRDGEKDYRQRFEEWAEAFAERSRTFVAWKRERFWELVRTANPRISNSTQEFIDTWWNLALADDAARLCDSHAARSLIRDRERRLKGRTWLGSTIPAHRNCGEAIPAPPSWNSGGL